MKVICAALLFLVGCSQDAHLTVHAGSMPPAPHDYISEMKAYARVHHLAYEIFCMGWSDDPDKQFQAQFCDTDKGGACSSFYIEDGTRSWKAADGPTQAEAAHRLLEAVTSEGMLNAEHKPRPMYEHLHQCPPKIEGKAE